MKPFLCDDFLLSNDCSRALYHEHAAKMPIIDYHNHLPPSEIAGNRSFKNITEAALEGDHYKWRAMRTNGVAEALITGDADPRDKWKAWAATLPYTMRNPLYHWQHLELQRYFNISETLDATNADAVYDACNELLGQDAYTARGLLRRQNVKALCTTDDPTDTLAHHKSCAEQFDDFKVLPTFRPDKAIELDEPAAWNAWIDRLAAVANTSIGTLDDALSALKSRHDYFHACGCRLSDHGLARPFHTEFTHAEAESAFAKIRSGKALGAADKEILSTAFMVEFGRWDSEKGWAMQLHIGPMRNNNTRMFKALGRDSGFDSIGDEQIAHKLSRYLDSLDVTDQLPKTILYNLNPKDNVMMATMAGNFQGGGIAGKVQFGSGWWFLDQLDGMERQMNDLSTLGLLSRFVGMLTDSRSFLSFPRHEYFRRLLCELFGRDIAEGKLPADMAFIGQIVEDICYNNAKNYFNF